MCVVSIRGQGLTCKNTIVLLKHSVHTYGQSHQRRSFAFFLSLVGTTEEFRDAKLSMTMVILRGVEVHVGEGLVDAIGVTTGSKHSIKGG